jgi:hypothetical protein
MLEGQVGVLSAGCLSPKESLDVLNGLKWSKLFRKDQYTYILYPDRQLPRFTDKNNIPAERINESKLFQKMLSEKNSSILMKDENGKFHFNSAFRNEDFLRSALDKLEKETYGKLLEQEKELVLKVYEEIFDHQSFTGRSGTFYGYEGLGSIYWHMVSKLLLAAQESYFNSLEAGADEETIGKIKEHYFEIKAGIGLFKSPELYGAFPTDAYSHTPGGAGVKQPGLTGQVKEDLITRFGELGIKIKNGSICFYPSLFSRNEMLESPKDFLYIDITGNQNSISMNQGQIGYTFCQVPIVYTKESKERITLFYKSGNEETISGNEIPMDLSSKIFKRNGEISKIEYTSPL